MCFFSPIFSFPSFFRVFFSLGFGPVLSGDTVVSEVAHHVHRPRAVLRPRHARSPAFGERLGYAETLAARPVVQHEVIAVEGNLSL